MLGHESINEDKTTNRYIPIILKITKALKPRRKILRNSTFSGSIYGAAVDNVIISEYIYIYFVAELLQLDFYSYTVKSGFD